MVTHDSNPSNQVFDSFPQRVQAAIVAYADAAELTPKLVIEFAIAHFLELEDVSSDPQQNTPKSDSILGDLPGLLQREIKNYAVRQEMPPEFVVELALAHFLDPDCVTFDDCQVRLQGDQVELLRQGKQTQQATAA